MFDWGLGIATFERKRGNNILMDCLAATGIPTIEEWADRFSGQARFVVTNHRKWVTWVREHDAGGRWSEWLDYVERRYEYAP
jgi:hypothetical protein